MGNGLPDYTAMEGLSDREILIMVVGELRSLRNHQRIFSKRCWALFLICLTVGLTGAINLLVAFGMHFSQG